MEESEPQRNMPNLVGYRVHPTIRCGLACPSQVFSEAGQDPTPFVALPGLKKVSTYLGGLWRLIGRQFRR